MKRERRRFPRLGIKIELKYKIFKPEEQKLLSDVDNYTFNASSKNITIEGLCIKTGQQLEPGTIVGLELFLPGHKKSTKAIGRIVWSKHIENEYVSGVELAIVKDKFFN